MTTVLTIVLAVLIAFNVWLALWTVRLESERRRKYQERLEECDERIGEVMNELGKAKQRLNDANSAKAALKRSFDETIKEYEKLQRDYRKLQDDFDALKQGIGAPVDAGQPAENMQPGEPANKPIKRPRGRAPRKTKKA